MSLRKINICAILKTRRLPRTSIPSLSCRFSTTSNSNYDQPETHRKKKVEILYENSISLREKLESGTDLLFGVVSISTNKKRIFNQSRSHFVVNPCNTKYSHGDIVSFLPCGRYAAIKEVVTPYNYVWGYIMIENSQKFLICPNMNTKIFIDPLIEENNLMMAENEIYLGKLERTEIDIICKDLEYLGKSDEFETQNKCLYITFGLAEKIDQICESKNTPINLEDFNDFHNRVDFNDHSIFTIDPYDSKDSDAAISYKFIDDQTIKIGVHIADVTYFLNNYPNLLKEASYQGSTCYLPTNCIPMFPNDPIVSKCSLEPDVIRPTVSVVFTLKNNLIVDTWIGRGIIKVSHSFSYGHAEKLINMKDESELESLKSLNIKEISLESFKVLKEIYKITEKIKLNRFQQFGSLNFPNIKFDFNSLISKKNNVLFDETNTPKSQSLVEELMLMANHEVSKFLVKNLSKSSLLRINPDPGLSEKEMEIYKKLESNMVQSPSKFDSFGLRFILNPVVVHSILDA